MGILMVVLDGAENTDYPSLSRLKGIEPSGYRNNTPQGLEADSLGCILTLLGVKKELIPKGRSYLEALALGLEVGETDLVFRGNLIEVDTAGRLVSCGKIALPIEENTQSLVVQHIEKYKYLLVAKNCREYFSQVETFLPHQNLGKPLNALLPKAPPRLQKILLDLIEQQRIFPWGQAYKEDLPNFFSLHGKKGAMVGKTEIALGIGKAMGMTCPVLPKATGDWDTDLQEKAKTALAMVASHDFVLLHINGLDECSHRQDQRQKQEFLQRIDQQVLGYLQQNAPSDLGIIVVADHETSCSQGVHLNSLVCYYLLNQVREAEAWLKQL